MKIKDIKVGKFYSFRLDRGNAQSRIEFVNRISRGYVKYCHIYVLGEEPDPRGTLRKTDYIRETTPISLIKLKLLYGEDNRIMNWVDKQIKGNK